MLRTLAAALVFMAGLAAIAFANTPWSRYASAYNSQVCHARQMMTLPRDLHVVALGSSRLRRGFGADTVTEISHGRFAQVFNLAQPGRLTVRNAVMFRDLLQRGHQIDVLVVEADIDLLRDGRLASWKWNGLTAAYMRWEDILQGTPRTLDNGARADPRLILNGLYQKLQRSALLFASGIVPAVVANTDPRPIQVCWRDYFDVESENADRVHARALTQARARHADYDNAFDRRFAPIRGTRARAELELLNRMRADARRAGVHLIVVRPQAYADVPYSPRVTEQIQDLVPEFRAPPPDLARRLNRMQIDSHHFGPEGRRLYTQWLTETILADMNARQAGAGRELMAQPR